MRPKKIRRRQSRRLAKAIGDDYIFEPSENRGASLSPVKYDRRRDFRQRRIFSRLPLTSKLDALCTENENSRPPVPEQIRHRFLTTFVDFLVLFSPKTVLSDAPRRTVSTQSNSVDGQRCGQAEFSSQKPSRDYSKLIPSGD